MIVSGFEESDECYFCGCGPGECIPEEHEAAVEEHRLWIRRTGAPGGAWNQKLALCAKCEWPLILHGPECEVLE